MKTKRVFISLSYIGYFEFSSKKSTHNVGPVLVKDASPNCHTVKLNLKPSG